MKVTIKIIALVSCLAAALTIALLMAGNANTQAQNAKPMLSAPPTLPEAPQLYVTFVSDDMQPVRAVQSSTNWSGVNEDGESLSFSSQGMNLWDLNQRGLNDGIVYLYSAFGEIELYFTGSHPPDTITVQRWTSAHVMGDFGMYDDIYYGAETVAVTGNRFRIANYDGHDYIYQLYATWGSNNSIYYFRTIGRLMEDSPGTPAQPWAEDAPSPWAADLVAAAIADNFVPLGLQSNFTAAITRAEFSALAVTLYENVRGEITGRISFADTNDVNVEKMAYIGVVGGMGDNIFSPNTTLTREQAAVFLARLANALGSPLPLAEADFADSTDIMYWALESVGQVQAAGVMSGVEGNRFAPAGAYTREQSIITMLRLAGLEDAGPDISHLSYEVGSVTVVSGGVVYEPFEHFLHGAALTEHGMIMALGIPICLETVMELQPVINLADDFKVLIDGDYANAVSFSWYDSNLEPVYSGLMDFVLPVGSGVYMLMVGVNWSNDANPTGYQEFTFIRYIFVVAIP